MDPEQDLDHGHINEAAQYAADALAVDGVARVRLAPGRHDRVPAAAGHFDSRDDLLLGLVEQAHGPSVAGRLATNLDLPVATAALHLLVAVLADETTAVDPTALLDALALEVR